MNNRNLLISAAIAGTLMAVFSSIPVVNFLNCLLCAWMWIGGIFAVWLYRRNTGEMVDTGRGAMIGVVAGLVGAVIGTILGLILQSASAASQAAMLQQLQEQMGETGATMPDMAAMAGLGLVFNFILYPLFGAIGGAIGAAIFKGRPGPAV